MPTATDGGIYKIGTLLANAFCQAFGFWYFGGARVNDDFIGCKVRDDFFSNFDKGARGGQTGEYEI